MIVETKRGLSPRRNDDRKTSAPMNRGSKLRELLADEEVESSEVVGMKQGNRDKKLDFSSFVVKSNKYDYPRMGQVPATYYRSVIADMQVREKNGVEILDVYYDLEDRYGREYHILQSYPAGSRPFRQLADALAAAGVSSGETADAGIGACEIISLDYVSQKSDFGSIVERKPYVAPPEPDDQDEDDEDGDYLTDEDS